MPRETKRAQPRSDTEVPTQATSRRSNRPSQDEARELRHIVAAVIVSGITLGFILVLSVKLLLFLNGSPRTTEPPPYPAADDITPPPCGAGDSCDMDSAECTCEAPMSCNNNSCTEPAKSPPICSDEEVKKLLSEISAKCKGDLETCPEDELKKFALASDTFDSTLARFNSSITIHFDAGSPPLKDPKAKDHYLKRLDTERNRQLFDEAKVILLISRSSPDRVRGKKNQNQNLIYSRERGRFAQKLLKGLYPTPAEQSRVMTKVKSLPLGSQKSVPVKDFRERHGNQNITWSPRSDRAFGNSVKRYEQLDRASKRRVDEITNQVTYIIPINCDLVGVE